MRAALGLASTSCQLACGHAGSAFTCTAGEYRVTAVFSLLPRMEQPPSRVTNEAASSRRGRVVVLIWVRTPSVRRGPAGSARGCSRGGR
ncbi:hypothetical protein G6F35_016008 [Rhizopus arrhizus]|nr:hypothetical protein G6F35_016008 [Rhizopus arrhizus]